MGEHSVPETHGSELERRAFMEALVRDTDALERMLDLDLFARTGGKFGVEQEMFLIDDKAQPSPRAPEILQRLDARFTTELALYNMEANLPPHPLEGDFLEQLRADLADAVAAADRQARESSSKVALIGILPTLDRQHLTLDSMTPSPRYAQLNRSVFEQRGREVPLVVRGIDNFSGSFDTVMPEAANTSLQLHLQVAPEDFARLYNLAQVISAPLLAAATNAPMFCGRRLWQETRVAIFESAVDTRSQGEEVRGSEPRVAFGRGWVKSSVLELFRENVAFYRVLLDRPITQDPHGRIEHGEPVELQALTLHNGTIWRWNRPCYGPAGAAGEKAHLRIENRVLPSGPTVLDAVANAAFFYGMMRGVGGGRDVSGLLDFSEVRRNFVAAARSGLAAKIRWLDGQVVAVNELILDELLPAADRGLEEIGVPEPSRVRYLDIVRRRVELDVTGSTWFLRSYELLREQGVRDPRARLTAAMVERQNSGEPVHRWSLPDIGDGEHETTVGDLMSHDLVTVRPEDLPTLAGSIMRWQSIRHIPVEDHSGQVLGMLTPTSLLRLMQTENAGNSVSDTMEPPPPIVTPDADVRVALRALLRDHASCVLVAQQGRLVGIVTERDLLRWLARTCIGEEL